VLDITGGNLENEPRDLEYGDPFGEYISLAPIVYVCLSDNGSVHGPITNKMPKFIGCESGSRFIIYVE
jgi:hypothetical protein